MADSQQSLPAPLHPLCALRGGSHWPGAVGRGWVLCAKRAHRNSNDDDAQSRAESRNAKVSAQCTVQLGHCVGHCNYLYRTYFVPDTVPVTGLPAKDHARSCSPGGRQGWAERQGRRTWRWAQWRRSWTRGRARAIRQVLCRRLLLTMARPTDGLGRARRACRVAQPVRGHRRKCPCQLWRFEPLAIARAFEQLPSARS